MCKYSGYHYHHLMVLRLGEEAYVPFEGCKFKYPMLSKLPSLSLSLSGSRLGKLDESEFRHLLCCLSVNDTLLINLAR